jgi:outer membrane protein assembly factor BamB
MYKFLATLLLLGAVARMSADNWPQWRGPFFNGSSSEKNLPAEWSKTTNLAWSASLPGPSAATPVVYGEDVYISTTDLSNQSLVAMCLEGKSGHVRWQNKIADSMRRDRQSTYSSPSPIADGQRAIFFYSSGELVAFDRAGARLWSRNIQTEMGTFAFNWTFSSTPILFGDRLYLQVLQRDVPVGGRGRADGPNESYLLAMDPSSGKTLWRQLRPSDAVAETRESFATPVPYDYRGRTDLLVVGGDCLSGHDAATGKELWRWGTWNPGRIGHWRQVVSPVAGDGIILVCAPKGSPVYAIKAGGSGTLGDAAIAWKSDQQKAVSADVPTPLFYLGDFFVLNDLRKSLSRVEPATGKVKWTVTTPGQAKYEASPTGADGKVYIINFKGDVSVIKADDGAVLSTASMGEADDDMIRSSVAIAQGHLYIRTNQKLFCVGKD